MTWVIGLLALIALLLALILGALLYLSSQLEALGNIILSLR